MNVLRAYADDSGSHAQSPVSLLGGVIGRREQCEYAEGNWKQLLEKWELPYFHTKEAHWRVDRFAGWPEPKRDECVGDFLKCVLDARLIVYATYIRREVLRPYFGSQGIQKPIEYSMLLGMHLVSVDRFGQLLCDPKVKKHISECLGYGEEAVKGFSDVPSQMSVFLAKQDGTFFSGVFREPLMEKLRAVKSYTFADIDQTPLLQASDLVSWAIRRNLLHLGDRETRIYAAIKGSCNVLEFDKDLIDNSFGPILREAVSEFERERTEEQ